VRGDEDRVRVRGARLAQRLPGMHVGQLRRGFAHPVAVVDDDEGARQPRVEPRLDGERKARDVDAGQTHGALLGVRGGGEAV